MWKMKLDSEAWKLAAGATVRIDLPCAGWTAKYQAGCHGRE